jgi:hypothetical protein
VVPSAETNGIDQRIHVGADVTIVHEVLERAYRFLWVRGLDGCAKQRYRGLGEAEHIGVVTQLAPIRTDACV